MPFPVKKKDIPKKITPCPIIDTTAEIRFTPNIHPAAVFGIIFGEFQNEYPKSEGLPILQIPENIIKSDPGLQFQPHYKISNENFIIQVGPQVLSIGCINDYPGWQVYSNKITRTFSRIKELNIANSISRIGLRYVNFFKEVDIFEKLEQEFSNESNFLVGNNSLIRTEIKYKNLNHLLQTSNHGSMVKGNEEVFGSIIDIDISNMIHLENFFDKINDQVDILHQSEKELFFGLLKDDYLKIFKPEY